MRMGKSLRFPPFSTSYSGERTLLDEAGANNQYGVGCYDGSVDLLVGFWGFILW
jgi:hypothetical protein